MANHTITLANGEETLYAKWLEKVGSTDAEEMARLKAVLTAKVVQSINEIGTAKFNSLTVAQKIAFINGT